MRNKHIVALFAVLILFCGCGSLKKSQTSEKVKETLTEEVSEKTSILMDTTKMSSGKVSIVEVEFFGDIPPVITHAENTTDPILPESKKPPSIETPDVKIIGPVKKAKITTIEKETEERGVSIEDNEYSKSTDYNIDSENESAAEPGKDPYRWRWIFGISVVVIIGGVLLYRWFKGSNVWKWIKKGVHL